ncbi:MAG: SPOR domain-containing protein [Treponema sp.]|jgi:tetratricopeptide (TPR) repeat protein|nr:SPOR domain-containing protein [Treponema sp.]
MVLIKRAFLFTLLFALAGAVYSQNAVSLSVEIQNMEKAVNKQGIPSAQRHETLVRLARLRQLSGDIEGAARNWLEAAAAIPGKVDDNALLACASCLAAMGEWDRASAALEPLLSKLQRARFLDASIKAIQYGDISVLSALADNPQFSQIKNEIYFMLWKISKGQSAEGWRGKLANEFPQSPEGRLAAVESSSTFIVQPSPFWFFANGLDSLPLSAETYTAEKPSQSSAVQQSFAPQTSAMDQQTAPVKTAVTSDGVRLQTGVYSQQVNADKQMDNLKKAGFSPILEQRNEKWAVVVPAGADTNRTIAELRAAGFESFPVR